MLRRLLAMMVMILLIAALLLLMRRVYLHHQSIGSEDETAASEVHTFPHLPSTPGMVPFLIIQT